MKKSKPQKIIIGRLESISLPELGIESLTVRVDSGARTSSLHVDNITLVKVNGKPGIQFDIHPEVHNVDNTVRCQSELYDVRTIKSSNGASEQRYVIQTTAKLGELEWSIQITLTDRSDMTYLMLLGRQAMGNKFLIDPAQVFCGSSS
ncbi:ribosomal protein S6 modification protein (plasmid) [Vibrio nigripulchritudo]|uniref:ATP-dependent zinc protease family protein n=1 Tax=Vibrio nigripulchritudo TaxID=28173 RepID=UPI00190DAF53|nr:RimK/LysX family protein [Vibrio nigripulchritudo]BCL73822.1 ribosomal protein S6 modification protein [Vibrio nigripulchritudo]BDU35199.1 ribosomal protein S6 modification protein [Vibrio nigripulchritudo]